MKTSKNDRYQPVKTFGSHKGTKILIQDAVTAPILLLQVSHYHITVVMFLILLMLTELTVLSFLLLSQHEILTAGCTWCSKK